MFAEQGVGAATVEQVTSAAGFTRGAFYSNFATKEELAVAMLDDHLARSQTHNRELARRHPDTAGPRRRRCATTPTATTTRST